MHVAELSACVVAFNHGCHLAQLHREFFHGQDVWCIADSGEIMSIKGGLNCQCNLRAHTGTCYPWSSFLYFVYTPHQSLKLNADSELTRFSFNYAHKAFTQSLSPQFLYLCKQLWGPSMQVSVAVRILHIEKCSGFQCFLLVSCHVRLS